MSSQRFFNFIFPTLHTGFFVLAFAISWALGIFEIIVPRVRPEPPQETFSASV